jgi:hypothetical protein
MQMEEQDYLAHYGILRRSGRYPWGSGDTQNTRNKSFLQIIEQHKREGMSDAQIAKFYSDDEHKMTVDQLRAVKSIAKSEQKAAQISEARRLHEEGKSNVEISRRMFGTPKKESNVRVLLSDTAADKADKLQATAKALKEEVDSKGFIDVGSGTEHRVGVSSTLLNTATHVLREQGYVVLPVKAAQLAGEQKDTAMKVLCPPGTTQRELFLNQDKIQQFGGYSPDLGKTYARIQPPISIDPKRVGVVYKDGGGDKADGVIYVRPGVKDVELGGNTYAQVRIKVGDGHYLKGMAVYKDDLPAGVDLQFHTGKDRGANKLEAMKPLTKDPELPFGSLIARQIGDKLGTPDQKVTSVMNIVNDQQDWDKWSNRLSSQMLSKQTRELAKSQLEMTYEKRLTRLDDIKKLTNPVVKQKLLEDFAGKADQGAVKLHAAALPRQAVHVLLPITKIKPDQIYAPNYENGERVVLIRHPHGGRFEIPELTVNNRNPEGRKLLGTNPGPAIGIHHTVAERLSGADFDGDTVLVIPNRSGKVKHDSPLADLKDFDPRNTYKKYDGMKAMTSGQTQTEMGMISNLITDMSLQGAPASEIANAVKHSMVVIDAHKHELNYKQSALDHGIKHLKEKYQSGGASTLISKARGQKRVPEREPRKARNGGPVNKKTGELEWEPTGRLGRNGKPRMTKTTNLADTRDARDLLSPHPTPMELIYADHSNRLKKLANEARRVAVNTPLPKQSESARKTFIKEVKSLDAKVALVERARPLERQANVIGRAAYRARLQEHPNLEKKEKDKIRTQELERARAATGAGKDKVRFTPEEWTAIQNNAISATKLKKLLRNADMEEVNALATPHQALLMSPAKTNAAKGMLSSGYTLAEVAQHLGVSLTTLKTAI